MATAAALLRSVATRTMTRAPSRLPSALEHHCRLPASSGGLWLSRFSTSTGGSMPPSANLGGPQTYSKKVPTRSGWHSFMASFIGAMPIAAYGLVFGGSAAVFFHVNRTLDRLEATFDPLTHERKLRNEKRHAALGSIGSQIEATDVVGQGKEMSNGEKI